jgi:2-polyprenyl-3-methyl-5-hydroxy-6-metoxy-1,4-benzoquinol methylase
VNCRACGSAGVKLLFTIEHVPVQSYLRLSGAGGPVPTIDLRIYQCAACSMIQLLEPAAHDIAYEDTLVDLAFSPSYQSHFGPLAAECVERFDLAGKHALEIGAGSGFFSELLIGRGARVSAIEPSRLAQAELLRKGVTVAGSFLDRPSAERLAGAFDAIVLLHVVEHVWNFREFLELAYAVLRDGGVGVVEVPSVEDAIDNVHLHCFYPEHVNYFSLATLHDALRMAGFHVVEIHRVRQREYLRAWLRKQEHPYREFLERAVTANASLVAAVREARQRGETVALWGAGARGVTLLASCRLGPDTIAYAADSDSHKWGKRMPVSDVPIYGPDRVRSHPPDLIVIATTPNYHAEVIADLRDRLAYRGRIGLLGSGFSVLEADRGPGA